MRIASAIASAGCMFGTFFFGNWSRAIYQSAPSVTQQIAALQIGQMALLCLLSAAVFFIFGAMQGVELE